MTVGVQFGAPGVYFAPVRPTVDPQVVHLDETGFVGITARGPVNTPVRVTGWSDFVRWFGGLPQRGEGDPPTLLATSVQTYFAQGGRIAWIVRVGPTDSACATAGFAATVDESLQLEAANEGAWGNLLSIALHFAVGAEFVAKLVQGLADATHFVVPYGVHIAPYSLLHIGGTRAFVADLIEDIVGDDVRTVCVLDRRLSAAIGGRVGVAVITGSLTVTDGAGRTERFDNLGLHPDHERCVPKVVQRASKAEHWCLDRFGQDTATAETSTLVAAPHGWTTPVLPDDQLQPVKFVRIADGVDRWAEIDRSSFFDDDPADADPLDENRHHRGVDVIGRVRDIGLLCVPDLAWRWTPSSSPTPSQQRSRSADFVRCCAEEPQFSGQLPAAHDVWLDPRNRSDLDEIISRQQRVVDVARLRHRFVILLDIPIGLPVREISLWRAQFGSSHAAAYHPWLRVLGSGSGAQAEFVPPSACAAGIIASRENRLGIHRGPANELAIDAVAASSLITDTVAAELIRLSVNAFRPERDGFRLQSARTLSADLPLRQLSVRRLMTMLTLTLERIGDRLVFEPGTPLMRLVLEQAIGSILSEFHRAGAFAGATEADSFFVRCDDQLNTPHSLALGQLIAEVGVAPAEPLEYIVVRIVQTADGMEVSERG